jgi:vacuolar-type H+-ATPase subunit I/STV1
VQQRSPAQKCAVVLGLLLVAAGIVGFFYNGTFTSNERVHDDLLGAFSVNGWSNTLHILLGIWGLAVASSWSSARNYGYAAGLLLVALGVWGFILGAGQSILSIVPVNPAVDWARLVLGLIAVLSGVATSPEPDPTTARVAS